MQQRQRAADQRIPQSSQPAGAVVPELIHVHANDFDEHQFRKSVENTLTAGPRIAAVTYVATELSIPMRTAPAVFHLSGLRAPCALR